MKEFKGAKRQRGWWQLAAAAVGAIAGYLGNKQSNDDNIEQSQAGRDWMEKMSNTSYQRATADMKASGLNPMLAYSQGGASTPSTQAPVMQSKLGGAVSSAQQGMQVMQAAQQIDTGDAQAEQARSTARKIESETLDRDMNVSAKAAEIIERESSSKHMKALAEDTQERILGTRYASSAAQMRHRAMMGEEEFGDKGKYRGTGYGAEARERLAKAKEAEYGLPEAKFGATRYGLYNEGAAKGRGYLEKLTHDAQDYGSSAWQKYQDWRNRNGARR